MPRGSLNRPQVGANRREISPKSAGVLHSMLPHFLNNQVFHMLTSSSSSGEQISGQTYPSFSTICLTTLRVNGLFKGVWKHGGHGRVEQEEAKSHLSPTSLEQNPPEPQVGRVCPENTLLQSPRSLLPTNKSNSCDPRFPDALLLSICRVPQSTTASNGYQEEFS